MGPDVFSKKLKDSRFRKTEEKVFEAYFIKQKRSALEIAQCIGVPKSTVFRHHSVIAEIKKDYIEYFIFKFRKEYGEINYEITLKQAISWLLLFVMKNKKYLRVFFEEETMEIVMRIIIWLRDEKRLKYQVLKEGLSIKLFCFGTFAILADWNERGLKESEIKTVFNRIVCLATIIDDIIREKDNKGLK